jgi:DNA mismatch repair ATPase MutS
MLGQSGVPIPAERALISIRSSVLTHFASAEKDFLDGDVSGRFESEVKLVADINREMDGGSLILLNETFQTTAYAEGAAGLWPILCHWSKKGGIWVLATHLRELLPLIGSEAGVEVTVARTQPGYKIEREK